MAIDLQPLLLEALRMSPGSVTDPALQALLSGTGLAEMGGTLPSAQELLGQLESANPTMGLIAKYLTARRASESEILTDEDTVIDGEASYVEEDQHLAQVVQRFEQVVNKLRAELGQLRARNDTCAAAVGACYLCWGEDPGCPACRGRGRPGFAMPDNQAFAQLVVPALRTLQAQKEVNQRNSKSQQSNGAIQRVTTKKGDKNA